LAEASLPGKVIAVVTIAMSTVVRTCVTGKFHYFERGGVDLMGLKLSP